MIRSGKGHDISEICLLHHGVATNQTKRLLCYQNPLTTSETRMTLHINVIVIASLNEKHTDMATIHLETLKSVASGAAYLVRHKAAPPHPA